MPLSRPQKAAVPNYFLASLAILVGAGLSTSDLNAAPPAEAPKPANQRAASPLPQRDLTVEFRQIEEGRDPLTASAVGRYSAGSSDLGGAGAVPWDAQMLQVRNGEKASLKFNDAIPMQWTSGVQAPNSNVASGAGAAGTSGVAGVAGASGSPNSNGAGAGVQQALVWFDSGQSMTVSPRWPGGNQSVVLELEVQRPHAAQRSGADLPSQTRNALSTTLTLPLAQWVTIAATGRGPRPGSYSSDSGLQVRRLLQVRVMVP